jgi:hypothetical protein
LGQSTALPVPFAFAGHHDEGVASGAFTHGKRDGPRKVDRSTRSVVPFEVLPGVSDELPIARVIDRLDPDDSGFERVLVLVHEPKKFELRRRRPDDENLFVSFERPPDFMKESFHLLGVLLALSGVFRVFVMNMTQGHQDGRFIDFVWLNVKNSSFFVVDPHGDIVWHRGSLS